MSSTRAANGTPHQTESGLPRDPSLQFLLPTYLREMGATPLIDGGEETRLARRMHEAKQEFASAVRALPPAFQRRLVEAGVELPGEDAAEWPLEHVERVSDTVRAAGKAGLTGRMAAVQPRLRHAKARLDQAREALILANLRLVVFLAKRAVRSGVSLMDLIQEGNIGLMKAVEKFDFERGNKFSTYAYWWIKQAIDRAIAEKGRMIRIPVHLTEKRKKLFRTISELRRDLGRVPTNAEIARAMKVELARVEDLLNVVPDPQGFDDLGSDDSREALQRIPDTTTVDPQEQAEETELRIRLERELGRLESREEEIVRLRFGIGREGAHTLEEIGKKIDLSRERVRQLEAIALRKLQGSDLLGQLVRTA